MMKRRTFEYQVVNYRMEEVPTHRLNQEGEGGWELVQMTPGYEGHRKIWAAVWKREVTDS